jgi:imidazole glycerol phosphate synthase glutamine amidotransferase subunit
VIAIVDYGRGNLGSVRKALAELAPEVVVTDDARTVARAQALVVPGDGAFADAMGSLERLGLAGRSVPTSRPGGPYLGICLGYQLLFTESEEFGHAKGLDVLPGVVRRFPPGGKVPHMGWNRPLARRDAPLLAGIPSGAYFYFVHSYYPEVSAALEADGVRAAHCEYGVRFPALVARDRLYGTPVPPGEEPGLGPPAPGELRPARGGTRRAHDRHSRDRPSERPVRPAGRGAGGQRHRLRGRPVAMARRWAERGARRLHIVDLDGAFEGTPRHAALIRAMVEAVPGVPVQIGGGLRDLPQLEAALATGACWAVLGTAAALEPSVLEAACRRWPGQILVGVDAVDGRVAVRGWTDVLSLTAAELTRRAAAAGAVAVVYTDIRRDGTGRGPNVEATAALAAEPPCPSLPRVA